MTDFIGGTTELSAGQVRHAGQAGRARRSRRPPPALPTRLRAILTTVAHLRATLAARRARRQELATMLSMTEQELDDLGIDREEVPRVVLGSDQVATEER